MRRRHAAYPSYLGAATAYGSRLGLILALVVMLWGPATGVGYAAPGDLDPTFGNGGIVTTSISVRNVARALVIQPDGKLVAAGITDTGSTEAFALVRYLSDGGLDPSFGSSGIVTTAISSGISGGVIRAHALVLQLDGKLVAAGESGEDYALVRYLPDGSLDLSFDNDGIVITSIGTGSRDIASALVLQPDGRLVAAGNTDTSSTTDDFALVRYLPDGTLDSSFGSGGIVTTTIGDEGDWVSALVLQPDGKLVAAGYNFELSTNYFTLARYLPDGSLDNSFGNDGIVINSIGPDSDLLFALVLQPDGKLVAAGSSLDFSTFDFALVRYNSDGSLDPTFGNGDGIVTTSINIGPDQANALVLQPDGKLVAVGSSSNGIGSDLALVRYRSDGRLDTSFGNGGIITTPVGFSSGASALVLQPDSKLVAAGLSYPESNPNFHDFALVRYLGGPPSANHPPVAQDDVVDPKVQVFVGSGGTIDVLANDTDPDDDPLFVSAVGTPNAGTATTDGSLVTYDPPDDANGTATFPYTADDGELTDDAQVTVTFVANDRRGDCDSDGKVRFFDVVAVILELFDTHPPEPWYEIYAKGFPGSPQGCDATADKTIDLADAICTVLIKFGHPACSQGLVAGAGLDAPATILGVASAKTTDGWETALHLGTGGNVLTAAGFTLAYDPAVGQIDPTDADNNGLPDALRFSLPAGVRAWATVDNQAGLLQVAVVGTVLPLPTLGEGELLRIGFDQVGAGELHLSVQQAEAATAEGVSVPLQFEGEALTQPHHLFLPAIE
jgi:uncharacterized delta-60 repeat protein